MKWTILIALLSAFVLVGCFHDSDDPEGEFAPGDIVGNWIWELDDSDVVTSIVYEAESGRYVGTVLSDTDCVCCIGERRLEFDWSEEDGEFIGRHLWGGCEYDELYWGDEEFLSIMPIDMDRIIVRYLDSVYTEGWSWFRLD